jgi:hypothetical protein
MAEHDRFVHPSLETPRRPGSALLVGLALALMAAGFAFAMPSMVHVSATASDDVALQPTGSTHTETATTPTSSPKDKGKEEDESNDEAKDDDEGAKADNHGSAVSTAAHCDIKGRAHGELVRSIAQNKDATVVDAEAACEAATAALATAGTEPKAKHEKSGKASKSAPAHGKPDADESSDSTTTDTETTGAEDTEAEDTETGPPAKAPKPDHPGKPKG